MWLHHCCRLLNVPSREGTTPIPTHGTIIQSFIFQSLTLTVNTWLQCLYSKSIYSILCQCVALECVDFIAKQYSWAFACVCYTHNPLVSSMFFLQCFFFNFFHVYFLRERERERERDRAWAGEGQRERETQNLKQPPGSELWAHSPTRGLNSQTAR